MKTPRFILAGQLMAVFSISVLPLQLSAAGQAKEEVLIDFTDVRVERNTGEITKHYEFLFGDWEKHVKDLPGRGALVQSKTSKGGMGENKPMLTLDKTPAVELCFVLGSANNATSLIFGLEDKDGTVQQWTISFDGMVKGQVQRYPLDLTKPSSEQKPGKTPGLNLNKIYNWEIKGDWTEPNMEILLVKLVASKV